jgi:hypothetical protein
VCTLDQDHGLKRIRLYSLAILICVVALSLSLYNGLERGHWFRMGIFTDLIVCASMAMNLVRALRNRPG